MPSTRFKSKERLAPFNVVKE